MPPSPANTNSSRNARVGLVPRPISLKTVGRRLKAIRERIACLTAEADALRRRCPHSWSEIDTKDGHRWCVVCQHHEPVSKEV